MDSDGESTHAGSHDGDDNTMIVQDHELPVTGEKRKRKEDDEELGFLNGHGGVIKVTQTREYGCHILQSCPRPKLRSYNPISSPLAYAYTLNDAYIITIL